LVGERRNAVSREKVRRKRNRDRKMGEVCVHKEKNYRDERSPMKKTQINKANRELKRCGGGVKNLKSYELGRSAEGGGGGGKKLRNK